MPVVIAQLQSVSAYSQSNFIASQKGDNETDLDFEKAHWRERIHAKPDGQLYIPAQQFSAAIKNAAPYLQEKVAGTGGRGTYRKHFDSGVFVYEDLLLSVWRDDVEGEWLMLPPNPNNPRTRVPKCMPLIREWEGAVTYTIYDAQITETVFRDALRLSGLQIGIGRYRPQNRGNYGRYTVKDLLWEK